MFKRRKIESQQLPSSSSSSLVSCPLLLEEFYFNNDTSSSSKPIIKNFENSECPVCCLPYNKKQLKPITCPSCQYTACVECQQRYLLERVSEANCMHCKTVWGFNRLFELFTKTWVMGTFSTHRENVLLGFEKSLLPQTMPYIEINTIRKQKETALTEKIRQARQLTQSLRYDLTRYSDFLAAANTATPLRTDHVNFNLGFESSGPILETWKAEITVLHNELVEMRIQDPLYSYQIRVGRYEIDPVATRSVFMREGNQTGHLDAQTTKLKKFSWKCSTVDCRGYLDEKFECALCHSKSCPKCLEILSVQQQHECKPENVETIKLFLKNSQQCPSCKIIISKIDGCDQMWCTQCHTSFNYKTGDIIQGRIHNPHLFAYERERHNARQLHQQQSNNTNDINNNNIIPHTIRHGACLATLREVIDACPNVSIPIELFYRNILHLQDEEIPSSISERDTVPFSEHNLLYRIKFLKKEITETEWKRHLIKQERLVSCRAEQVQIYQTWVDGAIDCFRNILDNHNDEAKQSEDIRALIKLTRLSNEAIHSLVCCYKIKLFYIVIGDLNNSTREVKELREILDPVKRRSITVNKHETVNRNESVDKNEACNK